MGTGTQLSDAEVLSAEILKRPYTRLASLADTSSTFSSPLPVTANCTGAPGCNKLPFRGAEARLAEKAGADVFLIVHVLGAMAVTSLPLCPGGALKAATRTVTGPSGSDRVSN